MTIAETFDDHWQPDKKTGCHVWLRAQAGKYAKFGRGYGSFRLSGKMALAHKFSWERENGPVPRGLHVLHDCDNTLCVNSAHLYVGTNADNVRDKVERGRQPSKLTHDDVREIRARVATGELQREVATDFDLQQADVSNIVNRKYWKHIA